MKKILIFIIGIFMLNSEYSFCQTINVQAGTSLTKLDWTMGDNSGMFNKTMVGYSAFVGADYLDSKFLNLSTNIGYIRKGGKDKILFVNEYGVEPGINNTNAILDYLSLNTLVEIKLQLGNIIPYINVGPRVDYLISNNYIFDEVKKLDGFKKVSFGLLLGGGLKFDLSQWQIGISAEDCLNFTKIADFPVQNGFRSGQIKDNTILLNLTIGYKLSKAPTSNP